MLRPSLTVGYRYYSSAERHGIESSLTHPESIPSVAPVALCCMQTNLQLWPVIGVTTIVVSPNNTGTGAARGDSDRKADLVWTGAADPDDIALPGQEPATGEIAYEPAGPGSPELAILP